MFLTTFIYYIGVAQTLYFFLLIVVPFSNLVRKLVLAVLFHSKFSTTFNQIQLSFLVTVIVLNVFSIHGIYEQYGFLQRELKSDHDVHTMELQTKVNFNKSLKYFYLTFYILAVNLCIYGYTHYLKKLDMLQDKIESIKESRKVQ